MITGKKQFPRTIIPPTFTRLSKSLSTSIGLINAPAKKRLFYTYGKNFCFEIYNKKQIKLNCTKKTGKGLVKAVSYSNTLSPVISEIHKKLKVTEYVRM